MTTPQFDIRPSLIKGDPADAYLHWTKEVMRLESINPKVLMDFSTPYPGVLCGVGEAKALLLNVLPKVEQDRKAHNGGDIVQVWAMEEGEKFKEYADEFADDTADFDALPIISSVAGLITS